MILKENFNITEENNCIIIDNPETFSIAQTFDCGQCFRFEKKNDSSYCGVAFGKYIELENVKDKLIIKNCTADDFINIWYDYFDFGFDYKKCISSLSHDKTLKKACTFSSGIHILHQDKWETLCSFIISQNNNIPRIKKIIENMCALYGDHIYTDENGKKFYSFPSAETLFLLGEKNIFDLKTGFRAKYIYDAAKKVALSEIDLDKIYDIDTGKARDYLMQIKGVGPKVALCVLLFAFRKYDAFPVDVWMKRVLEKYYDNKFDKEYFGKYAGIAQQYLFYYERCSCGVYLN